MPRGIDTRHDPARQVHDRTKFMDKEVWTDAGGVTHTEYRPRDTDPRDLYDDRD